MKGRIIKRKEVRLVRKKLNLRELQRSVKQVQAMRGKQKLSHFDHQIYGSDFQMRMLFDAEGILKFCDVFFQGEWSEESGGVVDIAAVWRVQYWDGSLRFPRVRETVCGIHAVTPRQYFWRKYMSWDSFARRFQISCLFCVNLSSFDDIERSYLFWFVCIAWSKGGAFKKYLICAYNDHCLWV